MDRIIIKEGNIVVKNEKECNNTEQLASMDDVIDYMCEGSTIQQDIVYCVVEGYLMVTWDKDTCDLDYIIIKK